jgi:hypothetical protein
MYNKLRRLKGTFKRKLSGVSDGAGGLGGITYSSYTTSIYFKEASPFYGNFGGIRKMEGGQYVTNQSFDCSIRYRSAFFPQVTDILVVDNVEYAISDIIDKNFMNQEVTFKVTRTVD